MEDENEKIEAALDALLNDNSARFDELVADILQDKVSLAVAAKREEFKQTAWNDEESDESEEVENEEVPEVQEEE